MLVHGGKKKNRKKPRACISLINKSFRREFHFHATNFNLQEGLSKGLENESRVAYRINR